MKSSHQCPKCGHHQILKILEVADYSPSGGGSHTRRTFDAAKLARYELQPQGSLLSSIKVTAEGSLEAWSCPRCGYSELYVKDPGTIPVDDVNVRLIEGTETRALRARVESLELTLTALMQVLHTRLGLSAEEVGLMMQRLDLADGVEDGKIGPDITRDAPSCARCGRPVNPNREVCLFCNAPVVKPDAKAAPAAPPKRMVTCSLCNADIPENDSYFGDRGLVCSRCFTG